MMKFIITLLFIGVIVSVRSNPENPDINELFKIKLKNLQSKCNEANNEFKTDILKDPLIELYRTDEATRNALKNNNATEFCKEKDNFIKAYRDFNQKLDSCYKPEEKYLVTFVPDIYSRILNYACKNNQERFRKIHYQLMNSDSCYNKIKEDSIYSAELANCTNEILTKNDIGETAVCKNLRSVQRCVIDLVSKACPDRGYVVTSADLLRELSDDALASCPASSASNLFTSIFLLCISFILLKYF